MTKCDKCEKELEFDDNQTSGLCDSCYSKALEKSEKLKKIAKKDTETNFNVCMIRLFEERILKDAYNYGHIGMFKGKEYSYQEVLDNIGLGMNMVSFDDLQLYRIVEAYRKMKKEQVEKERKNGTLETEYFEHEPECD